MGQDIARSIAVVAVVLTSMAVALTALSAIMEPRIDYYTEMGVDEFSVVTLMLMRASHFWSAKWWVLSLPIAFLWAIAGIAWIAKKPGSAQ